MNGISCTTTMEYGQRNAQLPGCERIVGGLRDLAYEHLVIDLEGYPDGLRFVQTTRKDGKYLIEIRYEEEDGPRMLRKEGLGLPETLETFRAVCLRAEIPEEGWMDVTEEILGKGEEGPGGGDEVDDIPFDPEPEEGGDAEENADNEDAGDAEDAEEDEESGSAEVCAEKQKTMTEWKREYKLEFRPLDAPPIIVPSITVETYLAVSKEQAERMRIRREIEPELPDAHRVYDNVWDLPKEWSVEGKYWWEWKIPKDRIEDAMVILYPDGTDYPYMQALDMIEGNHFYLIAWDD